MLVSVSGRNVQLVFSAPLRTALLTVKNVPADSPTSRRRTTPPAEGKVMLSIAASIRAREHAS
jgi:hypothetical protein